MPSLISLVNNNCVDNNFKAIVNNFDPKSAWESEDFFVGLRSVMAKYYRIITV